MFCMIEPIDEPSQPPFLLLLISLSCAPVCLCRCVAGGEGVPPQAGGEGARDGSPADLVGRANSSDPADGEGRGQQRGGRTQERSKHWVEQLVEEGERKGRVRITGVGVPRTK